MCDTIPRAMLDVVVMDVEAKLGTFLSRSTPHYAACCPPTLINDHANPLETRRKAAIVLGITYSHLHL
jgi:hypothetical protein